MPAKNVVWNGSKTALFTDRKGKRLNSSNKVNKMQLTNDIIANIIWNISWKRSYKSNLTKNSNDYYQAHMFTDLSIYLVSRTALFWNRRGRLILNGMLCSHVTRILRMCAEKKKKLELILESQKWRHFKALACIATLRNH